MLENGDTRMLTLAEASHLLPGRPHVSSLVRWGKRGVNGIRLRLAKVGGRWAVSRAALHEFIVATTAAADRQQATDQSVDRQSTTSRADTAGQKLDALVFRQRSRRDQPQHRTAS